MGQAFRTPGIERKVLSGFRCASCKDRANDVASVDRLLERAPTTDQPD